jgi:bifunctional N-acetylglucosamine-1-phosphate-uridyltransferase/glucosamine-1-phosphate-acetyltransferase GlmU-like protein
MLLVPAAGTGSRLGQSIPKLLVEVAGQSMIRRVLALYSSLIQRAVVVVHPSALEAVRSHLADSRTPLDLVTQEQPTGMLDAILLATPLVQTHRPRRVWITWCDQVALSRTTLEKLRTVDETSPAPDVAFPTCRTRDPYVHVARDPAGRITRVLHRREGDAMPEFGETDAGLFDLSFEAYVRELPAYAAAPEIGANTRERNFVPFVAWMAARGTVASVDCSEPEEATGVNTPDELARVEAYLRARAAK